MNTITTTDGATIYLKDRGPKEGPPLLEDDDAPLAYAMRAILSLQWTQWRKRPLDRGDAGSLPRQNVQEVSKLKNRRR